MPRVIATGATTPQLWKQNKLHRQETLLTQPVTSQWQWHQGSTLLDDDHWDKWIKMSADSEMAPQGLSLKHEATTILKDWEQFGCPTATGNDWTTTQIRAAIDRGPHKSTLEPDALEHFATEVADKVAKGQARVVLWDDIKHDHPKQLKISLVAAIPHKSAPTDRYSTCLSLCDWTTGELSHQSMIPPKSSPHRARSDNWDIH